ncbi:MAG TPA: DUF3299 domain-containing protein [Longimicrobiales bacterium]|nr:DUF3299 domain-containing protein [Longimicrobiales bacterium]
MRSAIAMTFAPLLLPAVLLGMRPAVAPADMHAATWAGIERAIAAGDPVTLDWKAMAALNYRTGQMPESLRKLNGVQVRIPGFMVPLEDTETRVTEFLLVPYFGACIHVPPPPPNQMVHALMERNQKVDVNLWDPIWLVGKLRIENTESPYGAVSFQVTGERILPYDG